MLCHLTTDNWQLWYNLGLQANALMRSYVGGYSRHWNDISSAFQHTQKVAKTVVLCTKIVVFTSQFPHFFLFLSMSNGYVEYGEEKKICCLLACFTTKSHGVEMCLSVSINECFLKLKHKRWFDVINMTSSHDSLSGKWNQSYMWWGEGPWGVVMGVKNRETFFNKYLMRCWWCLSSVV